MRLIDADALLEQMQPVSTFKINTYADAVVMTIANAYIKLVENQPTVEAPDINVGNMDTTTHDSIPAETGKNDGDRTSGDCISRQPERKPGRWIYGESEVGNDGYYCSECGNFVPWIYEEFAMNFIREYKFCPNCGTKMEGR